MADAPPASAHPTRCIEESKPFGKHNLLKFDAIDDVESLPHSLENSILLKAPVERIPWLRSIDLLKQHVSDFRRCRFRHGV